MAKKKRATRSTTKRSGPGRSTGGAWKNSGRISATNKAPDPKSSGRTTASGRSEVQDADMVKGVQLLYDYLKKPVASGAD